MPTVMEAPIFRLACSLAHTETHRDVINDFRRQPEQIGKGHATHGETASGNAKVDAASP
jgi:hypothetical protein